jgi:hypothetical protein
MAMQGFARSAYRGVDFAGHRQGDAIDRWTSLGATWVG